MLFTRSSIAVAILSSLFILGKSLEGQEIPRPTREHDFLKKFEGTWDAKIKADGEEYKGTSTFKMELGGLWLASEFVGDFGGFKFEGKGMDSYDTRRKKYVSVWCDSMTTSPLLMEGTVDASGKKMTMAGEGPAPDGKMTKYTSITEFKSDDLMLFTLSAPGPDGKEQSVMSVEYQRKK